MNKSIHEIVRENIDTDNIENLRLLSRQGWTSDIFTRENLEYAAVKGSVETTRMMANSYYPTMTHDAKVDAMFAASKAHQVGTVLELNKAGVSLGYAIGSVSDHENDRAFVQAIVDTGYHPTAEDMHFFQVAGKEMAIEAISTRDQAEQALYKEAFISLVTSDAAGSDLKTVTTMLSAAAQGTAAHIDYHVGQGEKVNHDYMLQPLGVALWHSNNETAQALIKHGATVEPAYIQVAEKYCKSAVEALKTAQKEQLEQQIANQPYNKPKPVRTVKKSKGMSM